MDNMTSNTPAKADVDEQRFVEKWLETNEDSAMNVVGRWLLNHSSRAKTLLQRVNTQTSCQSVLGSLNVEEEAQRVCKHLQTPNRSKLKPVDVNKMEKNTLFMELLRDVISPNFDINALSHKILVNVMLLVNADRSSLFLIDEGNSMLVSRLFDVTVDSAVEDAMHNASEAIKIPIGKGIAGHVAETRKPINIPDAYSVCLGTNSTLMYTHDVCACASTYMHTIHRTHDLTSKWTSLPATRPRQFCVCRY